MRFVLAIVLITVSLISCGGKEEPEVIPEDEFIEIMTDIYMADALVSYELGKDMDELDKVHGFYKTVFEKHDITKEEFETSFDYYSKDLERMKQIVMRVQDNVTKIENASIDKSNQEEE